MARRPEIGNVALYPDRPLTKKDKNGYVLKFYCPIEGKRIRRNCGTRDRREARKILRECRERLLNGEYVASNGAITANIAASSEGTAETSPKSDTITWPSWDECYDRYLENREQRLRSSSLEHIQHRLSLFERIVRLRRDDDGCGESFTVADVMTLDMLEYVQERLLAGDEGRSDERSVHTVNSTMTSVMAFARFCFAHDWIPKVPPLEKLDFDEAMKGRPITNAEFKRLLDAVPKVVGDQAVESWSFALRVLWESGFRVGDLMNFSWDDRQRIHPVWPTKSSQIPTVIIPSSQKNGRVQETPLLPGLNDLLKTVPEPERFGWVANPRPLPDQLQGGRTRPSKEVLSELGDLYSNSAIAEVCHVSETAVRKWRVAAGLPPISQRARIHGPVSDHDAVRLRESVDSQRGRLSTKRVGKIISLIGQEARIIVKDDKGQQKYASAHDIRRGCALRLIDLGVSAETLKLVMRHKSFATTEKYYGATRSAQAAGLELRRLVADAGKTELVGGLMGGPDGEASLDPEELAKLKALLARL